MSLIWLHVSLLKNKLVREALFIDHEQISYNLRNSLNKSNIDAIKLQGDWHHMNLVTIVYVSKFLNYIIDIT